MPQHLRTFFGAGLLAFGFRHRAAFTSIITATAGTYNRYYRTAQQILYRFQLPPVYISVSKSQQDGFYPHATPNSTPKSYKPIGVLWRILNNKRIVERSIL
jgi:hypothetical protein